MTGILGSRRTLLSTWKDQIVPGRTMIGILGSIWTPRLLSWTFQVLFGTSRYSIESSICDNLKHQKRCLEVLFFLECRAPFRVSSLLICQAERPRCYAPGQAVTQTHIYLLLVKAKMRKLRAAKWQASCPECSHPLRATCVLPS